MKNVDIVNLLMAIIAVIIAMIAILDANNVSETSNGFTVTKLMTIIGTIVVAIVFGYSTQYVIRTWKKNNKLIFKIEKVIIQHYDEINKKTYREKDCILEELKLIFTTKERKNADRLIELLTDSDTA